ncbi:MAG: hypothetical protein JEZ07_19700 [Phycisphaerae bacterium]|nr:hypothetical protein [Phycisphaerae bacterium]
MIGSTPDSYSSFAGLLCGFNFGTIDNCHVSGKIHSDIAGGICGINFGIIKNSFSAAVINGRISGGICGQNSEQYNNDTYIGIITNCHTDSFSVDGYQAGGGICGYNLSGQIINCDAVIDYISGGGHSSSYSSPGYGVGGLCGYNDGQIISCNAKATVSGGEYAGGLCGWHAGGSIINSYTNSNTSSNLSAGGLCGIILYENSESGFPSLFQCYASGTVTGGQYAGGLCGVGGNGTISQCYATGTVLGEEYVGGLCGINDASIDNSYAIANLGENGNNNYNCQIGGLCGYYRGGPVSDCYSACTFTPGVNTTFYGFLDNNSFPIPGCFYDKDLAGFEVHIGGFGITTALMQDRTTYSKTYFPGEPHEFEVNWDFTDTDGDPAIWRMREGVDDYPKLAWQFPATDISGDIDVNLKDFSILSNCWLTAIGEPGFDQTTDINNDEIIDLIDMSMILNDWLSQ